MEKDWKFTSYAELRGVIRQVDQPDRVILLLHGLGERGKRIFRKLLPYLPPKALVIAPNGPFPIQRNKEGRMDFGHSWYFYDKFEGKYFINQDLAKYWLRDLIEIENKEKLPVTIIGFSQGGYLAPVVASEVKETELVIGIACEFRNNLVPEKCHFNMVSIHGDKDEIVLQDWAKREVAILKDRNIFVDFYSVNEATHEINVDIAKTVQKVLESYGKRSL